MVRFGPGFLSFASRYRRVGSVAATGLFFLIVGLLLFSANMQRGMSHDEHMYVAGGELLARGLLPYRDFPYLQMPNLAFIYAGVFRLSGGYLLAAARVVSTVAALGSLMLVFGLACSVLRGVPFYMRFLLGAGSVLLVVNSPIFGYASGQAWNHDVSIFFCMAAFALHCRSMMVGGVGKWVLLSGLMVGLAVGTRLVFALVAPVFMAALFWLPARSSLKEGLRLVAMFSAGVALGLLPSLFMFALAPGQFLFGNLAYHGANAEFWQSIGYTRGMDLPSKLGYLWEVVAVPGNLTLALGLIVMSIVAIARRGTESIVTAWRRAFIFSFAMLVALLLGAFVPSPVWYQYFYAALPFAVLCMTCCVAGLQGRGKGWSVGSLGAFSVVVLMSFGYRPAFYPVENLLTPDKWTAVKAHDIGEEIRRQVGEGNRVLTLAPIYPLEGGTGIYTDFAAGVFTWRSITLLSEGERAASGLLSPGEVDALLQKEPPQSILTGIQRDLEARWVELARRGGYKEVALGYGLTLWLAPGR